jgi:hypothetical protein
MADFPAPTNPYELQVQQAAIQRQRDLAAMLQKDSMAAPQGQMISGYYVPPSFMQMAAKLAEGLSGSQQQKDLDTKQLALAKSYNDTQTALAQALIGGAPAMGSSQAPAPSAADTSPVQSAPVMPASGSVQPAQGGNPLFKGINPSLLANYFQNPTGAFGKIVETQMQANAKALEPTDVMKSLAAAGIQQGSPAWNQALNSVVQKAGYIAPTQMRGGSTAVRPDGTSEFFPQVPEGYQPVRGPDGSISIQPIPGGPEAVAGKAAATAKANASYKLEKVFNQRANQYELRPITDIVGAGSGSAQASRYVGQDLLDQLAPPMRDAILKDAMSGNGKFNLNVQLPNGRRIVGPVDLNATAGGEQATGQSGIAAAPPLGAETTANKTAGNAVDNWSETHKFATESAPRNIGLLQSIEQLADKAIVGKGASRANFVAGVLQTMGLPVSPDKVQNYQIMSKNLGMLVGSQRMGAQGGGSDALQSLLEASNPNVDTMNAPALKEAAQELIAYNRMMMAHDKALPNPNQVSSQQYADTETKLATFRDPRLWQLEHAADDKERTRILSLVPASERGQLLQKAKQARQMGILN